MRRSFTLEQADDDEDHEDEDEEGHGETDVEREVGGGELVAGRGRVLVVVLDQDGKVVAGGQLRSARPARAVLAHPVLALAVAASVSGSWFRAASAADLETVCAAG